MVRMLLVMAFMAEFVPATSGQSLTPNVDKTIRFTRGDPIAEGIAGAPRSYYQEFPFNLRPGDKFQVEIESVRGQSTTFTVRAMKPTEKGYKIHETSPKGKLRLDWTMHEAPPGEDVRIRVQSTDLVEAKLKITRVGIDEAPAAVDKDARIRQLETENAKLRKDLEDIKKRLEKKK